MNTTGECRMEVVNENSEDGDNQPQVPVSGTQHQDKFDYTGIFGEGGFIETISAADKNSQEDDPSPSDAKANVCCTDSTATSILGTEEPKTYIEKETEKIKSLQCDSTVRSGRSPTKIFIFPDHDCDSDIPSHESALGIEHIAEKIFGLLETSDLLNCRLVCTPWKVFVASSLQNRIKLNILDFQFHSVRPAPTQRRVHNKSLKEFTLLLKQVGVQNFPCSKFHITCGGKLSDSLLQDFLNENGLYIKELSLNFCQGQKEDDPNKNSYLPDESAVMKEIKNLLTTQAPNLRFLLLRVASKVEWKSISEADQPIRKNYSPLLQTDAEFNEIHQDKRDHKIMCNTKLRVVQLGDDPSAKILETIVVFAPNLEQVILNEWNCDFYLSPLNRLQFLQTLSFNPFSGRLQKLDQLVEAMELELEESCRQSQTWKSKLRLREIILHFMETGWHLEFDNPLFGRIVVQLVNRIFKCNASSLEIISWNGVSFLGGMNWPRVMPKVWKLKLGNPRDMRCEPLPTTNLFPDLDTRAGVEHGQNLLKGGTKLSSKMFPKLRTISLYADVPCEPFQSFLNYLNFEPMPAVENVDIYWNNGEWISQESFQFIAQLFPRAKINRGRY